jgi:hypothetical protein
MRSSTISPGVVASAADQTSETAFHSFPIFLIFVDFYG